MPQNRIRHALAAFALVAGAAFAQAPAGGPAFEVATIKPAPEIKPADVVAGKLHVGMNIDAARVDIGYVTIRDLVCVAYKMKPYQVTAPDWATAQRFDIIAKIPEGATKEQVPEMLQALLADRFKLVIKRDKKEQPIYALLLGKNGPKMKPAVPEAKTVDEAAAEDGPGPSAKDAKTMTFGSGDNQVKMTTNKDGSMTVVTKAGGKMHMRMDPAVGMHLEAEKMNMQGLAEALSGFIGRPVQDFTELKGDYQIALDLSMGDLMNAARAAGAAVPAMGGGGSAASSANPQAGHVAVNDAADPTGSTTVFKSIQELGLRLESRKAAAEQLVIVSGEKMPTEN